MMDFPSYLIRLWATMARRIFEMGAQSLDACTGGEHQSQEDRSRRPGINKYFRDWCVELWSARRKNANLENIAPNSQIPTGIFEIGAQRQRRPGGEHQSGEYHSQLPGVSKYS